MAEHNMEEAPQYAPPLQDVLVSVLGALVIGGVVWGSGVGVVAGINYGAALLEIYPPANEMINTAIQAGYVAGPILAGLLAAWLSYRFLLKLD